jgi:hypothetical protein
MSTKQGTNSIPPQKPPPYRIAIARLNPAIGGAYSNVENEHIELMKFNRKDSRSDIGK